MTDSKIVSQLRREGDDIYWGEKKLNISIATVSPVSALIHFAINIVNEGTPVATCALQDFNIEPQMFAEKILTALKAELESMDEATQKVHWVK